MPRQTIFYEQQIGDKRIEVLKSYDTVFAREAFDGMNEDALRFLGKSLELGRNDPTDIPSPDDQGFADTLWDEVQDGAREDWNAFSYFIVIEEVGAQKRALYVSSDWPSAEAFAKRLEAKSDAAL